MKPCSPESLTLSCFLSDEIIHTYTPHWKETPLPTVMTYWNVQFCIIFMMPKLMLFLSCYLNFCIYFSWYLYYICSFIFPVMCIFVGLHYILFMKIKYWNLFFSLKKIKSEIKLWGFESFSSLINFGMLKSFPFLCFGFHCSKTVIKIMLTI